MARWLVRLAVLLLAAGLPAAAAAQAPIRVTIEEAAGGVRIAYRFPAPVSSFAIRAAGQNAPPPGTHIEVVEPGLRYRAGRVEGSRPFRSVTLTIAPDDGDVDSSYPLLSRVAGRGFVLYAPYVLPDAPFSGRVSIGGGRYRSLAREEAAGGYVVVGAQPLARGAVRGLTGSDVPAGLQARLFGRVGALLDLYRTRLHRRLPWRPALIVTYVDAPAGPGRPMFRGDVTPNGTVFMRFRATADQIDDPQSTRRLTSFLAHELFHLWNRRLVQHAANEAWLHEGAADYFAWLATATLWPDEVRLADNLGGSLHGCAAFLADRGLAALPMAEAMQVRYSCGPVLQWLADIGIRAASRGRRDGFDLWSDLLAGGRGDYDVPGFLAAVRRMAPATAPFVAAMVGSGADWGDLAPAANAAGAEVTAAPPGQGNISFAATRALVRSMCTAFWGAGEGPDGVYFNSEPCGLAGRFTFLLRVDGLTPHADFPAYFAHVQGACARGAEMDLLLRDENGESRRRMRCTVPPAPPMPVFRIVRALPVSPPERSSP